MENFKILDEKENLLFNRKEIKLTVDAEVAPKNSDTEKFISEKLSIPIENIKLKKISGRFGSNTFTIITNIYDSEQQKNKIESKFKKTKAEKK